MRGKDFAAIMVGTMVSFTIGSIIAFGLLSKGWTEVLTSVVVITAVGGWVLAGLNYVYEAGKRICTEFFGWFY